MKHALRLVAFLSLLAGVAACDSIGDGSTVESLEIQMAPVASLEQGVLVNAGEENETLSMLDCFCSNVAVLARFTNGTLANFSLRATFSSDNPSVVEVRNGDDANDTRCVALQQGAGLLVPVSAGSATITAEFAGLSDTLRVEVATTDLGSFEIKPLDPANTGEVAVGGTLPLQVTGIVEGRPRTFTGNVDDWAFDPPADTVATLSSFGVVRGLARDGGTPLTATATFSGACTAATPLATQIRVGDIVEPMSLVHQAGFVDGKLAVNTNEDFQVVAALAYGDGNTGVQDLTGSVRMDYEQPCTLRTFDATSGGCVEAPGTCLTTTSACGSQTTCTEGQAACRVEPLSFTATLNNRVIAANATNVNPAAFHAKFPASRGATGNLTAAVDAIATTITVDELIAYPTVLPWDGVIDASGAGREIVRVTAVDGTTLTVERGIGGTTAQSHAVDATFDQRTFASDTQQITVVSGTLNQLGIDGAKPLTLPTYETQQVEATGQFISEDRAQPVTRLASGGGGASITWTSSDRGVATVTATTGLVAAQSPCGGTTAVRVRANNSTVDATQQFVAPADATADVDGNGNDDSNDTACLADDALCDQVNVCVPRAAQIPLGTVCEDPAPACP